MKRSNLGIRDKALTRMTVGIVVYTFLVKGIQGFSVFKVLVEMLSFMNHLTHDAVSRTSSDSSGMDLGT